MKRIYFTFFVTILCCLSIKPHSVFAGAAVKKREMQQQRAQIQMKKQRQAQIQAKKRIIIQQQQKDQMVQGKLNMHVPPIAAEFDIPRPASQRIPDFSNEPITEADVNDLWEALQNSSEVWYQLVDFEAKEMILERYISMYKNKGIIIKKSPTHYAKFIDKISQNDPRLFERPFDSVLNIIATMEYDFLNGEVPDARAQKILDEASYLRNRERLGF